MFVKCQSSFCEYDTNVQKKEENNKTGEFYGCEKLYFNNGKEKQEIEKRILL